MASSLTVFRLLVMMVAVLVATLVVLTSAPTASLWRRNEAAISGTFIRVASKRQLQLPYRDAAQSVQEILQAPWVGPLQKFLSKLTTKHVNLCVADSKYTESLVHWLVSALVKTQPPMQNVMVISLDRELHDYLERRGLDSVHVDPWTVLRSDAHMHTNFSHIWATRMVLFRMLNFWNYSVATFDSDALILRNPQPLFQRYLTSDILGSNGIYPFGLHREWKSSTLCMGTILFRATQGTELFWDLATEVQSTMDIFDDQGVLNYALKQCRIKWKKPTFDRFIHGYCKNVNLRVTVISESVVCRKCSNMAEYMVWHPNTARGQEKKRESAKDRGKWFLRKEWMSLDYENSTGLEWLRKIAL